MTDYPITSRDGYSIDQNPRSQTSLDSGQKIYDDQISHRKRDVSYEYLQNYVKPVSYTHLTLPTIYSV